MVVSDLHGIGHPAVPPLAPGDQHAASRHHLRRGERALLLHRSLILLLEADTGSEQATCISRSQVQESSVGPSGL